VPRTGAERAKPLKVRSGAERERTCQLSTSIVPKTVGSLMESRIEMRSADTDMDVEEPTIPVGVQLRTLELRPPQGVKYGIRNRSIAKQISIACF
jgi:hypothetical protein